MDKRIGSLSKEEVLALSPLTSSLEFSAVVSGIYSGSEAEKVLKMLTLSGIACKGEELREICHELAAKRMQFYPE